MKPPFIRTPFNYDTNQVSDETGIKCLDKTRAQQHLADEANINTIVERYLKTGQMPETIKTPTYGDFSGILDFQTAMNAIRHAQENFDALPAKVRARFHNNPQEFLEFCTTDGNAAELINLGLATARDALSAPGDKLEDLTQENVLDVPKGPQTPKVAPSKKGTT